MARKLLIVLAVLTALLLVLIVTRPDTYTVERSTSIAAPPAVVYGLVSDFHRWDGWSPWAKLDPSMKTTFGGPSAGVGATYAWEGNDKVGSGKMTIVEEKAPQAIGITLEFLSPMASISQTQFLFKEEAGGTKVLWRMVGHNTFAGKAFTLVMNIDQMVGKDFDRGLALLKSQAEATAREAAEAAVPAEGSTEGAPPDAGTP